MCPARERRMWQWVGVPGRYMMSDPKEEMFSPVASLPAFACLPLCCSCLKAALGKKLSRKAVCREWGEVQEDRAGDQGKKGGTAGLLPGHVWGGFWLHPWLSWSRCLGWQGSALPAWPEAET